MLPEQSSAPVEKPRPPTLEELAAAAGRTVSDVIGPGLRVLFCGINPSLYTAVTGYHFARPGNRFWPALHASGFTDRQLHPSEQHLLLTRGCGITNLVGRATATAAELSPDELRDGGRVLQAKLRHYRPRSLAVLGISAFRTAFAAPGAAPGRQPAAIAGVAVWLLPNPSGLNAHYQLTDLARMFGDLRREVEADA